MNRNSLFYYSLYFGNYLEKKSSMHVDLIVSLILRRPKSAVMYFGFNLTGPFSSCFRNELESKIHKGCEKTKREI